MKTLCTDLVNEGLVYVCQENDIPEIKNYKDTSNLNAEQRNKLISQLPKGKKTYALGR